MLLLMASFVLATAGDAIKERQGKFDSIKDNMKAIGAAVKAGAKDKKTIEKNAKEMAEHFIALKSLFPRGSQKGLTDANAKIWKDAKGFQRGLDYSANVANELAIAAKTNKNIPEAFKKVGDTCKSCHKEYRKPRDQSYKKR